MKWLCFVAILILNSIFVASASQGQTQTFDKGGVEYVLDFPATAWRAEARVDVHEHIEFVNGTREEGYLRMRKNVVDPGTTPDELFKRDSKQSLQFLPGYVICGLGKGEQFSWHLSGIVFEYEFTSGGQPMTGRIYYFQVNARTIYTLYFTAVREKFPGLRDQMDFIARSFRMKAGGVGER